MGKLTCFVLLAAVTSGFFARPEPPPIIPVHPMPPIPLAVPPPVNPTLGPPTCRTPPGPGTASDFAGKGLASPHSMIAAIRMAADITRRRQPPNGASQP